MSKHEVFDLLIVYTQRLATSAGLSSDKATTPFIPGSKSESYNLVYGYFLDICRKHKLRAAFTTSRDIIGPGLCRSHWTFESNIWQKKGKTAFSKLIFDKFSPLSKKMWAQRQLLFSSPNVRPFNDKRLFDLFFDKQKAYKKLAKFSIPTVTVESGARESLTKAQAVLKRITAKHPNRADFSRELIIKDRFGAGGLNIFKIDADKPEKILKTINKHRRKSFVIQPFVKFERGFSYLGCLVSADIRLIYLGGRVVQAYLRMAKKGDFRCNEHQGGRLKYIDCREIPVEVTKKANQIAKILNKKKAIFALDFIISNAGNIYLLEGNTGPGLDWNISAKENEVEAKKLIRIIVKEMAVRIVKRKTQKQKIKEILPVIVEYPPVNLLHL